MADFKLKNGQGSAFRKNKSKDTQPDFKGEVLTPSGEMLEISMWEKKTQRGDVFYSISLQKAWEKPIGNEETNTDTTPKNDDFPY